MVRVFDGIILRPNLLDGFGFERGVGVGQAAVGSVWRGMYRLWFELLSEFFWLLVLELHC